MAWNNHFLDSLALPELALIENDLQTVTLRQDDLIVDIEQRVEWVVLPVTSIVSVVTVMQDGKQIESRTIGREGGFGLLHAIGSRVSYERMLVQVGGEAFRIRASALHDAAQRRASLANVIVRHGQATIVQTAQFIACNSLHSAKRRLCRWLLMTGDRLASDVVPLTQEHLSIMLGVQRTTVTELALELKEQKLISYSRGKIALKDRAGLKACACECYGTLTASIGEILADTERTS